VRQRCFDCAVVEGKLSDVTAGAEVVFLVVLTVIFGFLTRISTSVQLPPSLHTTITPSISNPIRKPTFQINVTSLPNESLFRGHATFSELSTKFAKKKTNEMGAENSQMRNVSIAEKQLAERLRNDVVLYDGRLNQSLQKVSIFEDCNSSKENPFLQYTLDRPLTRTIRNLKIYRHPYSIVKFLGADKVLVTEFLIGSLEKNLKNQSEIQICLGLKNILNALIFLVESAKVRHLNISIDFHHRKRNVEAERDGARLQIV
jgi:hypothetical protein